MGWMKAVVGWEPWWGSEGSTGTQPLRHLLEEMPGAERWKRGFQKPRACPVPWVFLEPCHHLHFTLAHPQSPTQPMLSAMPSMPSVLG